MTDPASQLATLCALREMVTDPAQGAALDALIAGLTSGSHNHDLSIHDNAQVGTAVSGGVSGDIQSGGERYQALLQIFFQAAGVTTPDNEQSDSLISYLNGLERRYDRMHLNNLIDWQNKFGKLPKFTLSQLYITLASKEWQTIEEANDEAAFIEIVLTARNDEVLPQDERQVVYSANVENTVDWSIGTISAGTQKRACLQRPLLLTEAITERCQVVLLGGLGTGKSAFLRYLAVILARARDETTLAAVLPGWNAGLLLPVYASLGGFAAWIKQQRLVPSVDALWTYLLIRAEGVALDGLAAQIKRAFRNRRLLLLLDGLDEVTDPLLRVEISMAITALAQPGGFVIVTCRNHSFTNEVARPFREWGEPVELAILSLGQIKHFLSQWHARGAETLIDHLHLTPSFGNLIQVPLFLNIIMVFHCYVSKLPEDRAYLYEQLFELMLNIWATQRREAGIPPDLLSRLAVGGLRQEHIRDVIENLAYRIHHHTLLPDGRGLIDEGIARNEMIKLFYQFDLGPGLANEKVELVLTYLTEEICLLLREDDNKYVLPYLIFEEYLAACALIKLESKFHTTAYKHWQNDPDRWKEVIFLALKRMVNTNKCDMVTSWLRFLLLQNHGYQHRDEVERQRASLFAAECLAAIGHQAVLVGVTTVDLPALWDDLALALAQIIENEVLSPDNRVSGGELLCLLNINDPRPGVCSLPPALLPINGNPVVIGITPHEFTQLVQSASSASERDDLQQWYMNSVNEQDVEITNFDIAQYPITNAQYALFVNEDGYNPEKLWWGSASKAWLNHEHITAPEHWSNPKYGKNRLNYPIVGVSWYEADAFCQWLTLHQIYNPNGYIYRLPSEAEWEYAARGTERRLYPWGNINPSETLANFGNLYSGTTPVGCFSLGATPNGIKDMAGNVWEWTRSSFAPSNEVKVTYNETQDEIEGKRFIIRGGGWFNLPIFLRSFTRNSYSPNSRYGDVGFRIIRQLS